MTYIVGLDRPIALGREGAGLFAESLRAMAERHEGYASAIGLSREQRKALRDNASIARTNAARVALGRRLTDRLA